MMSTQETEVTEVSFANVAVDW